MSRSAWGLVALILAAAIAGSGYSLKERQAPVVQPLAFSHKLHMKQDVECSDCHRYGKTGPYMTIALIDNCMDCHNESQSKSPEEPKVREYAKQGKEIPWVILNHYPGYVYFSHAAHVKLAKMKCEECHGNIKDQDKSITVSNIHLTMSQCLGCHEKKRARVDCIACHK